MDISNKQKPFIIAGPCSAENEEQILKTAEEISKIKDIDMLRAGLWKPRTSPGSFEGRGEKGLNWLIKTKEKTELPIIVEVATPSHVKKVLKKDIDAIWLGARTTVNPFSVQSIANELEKQNSNIPVFIKNPINPEVKLWNGAVERIKRAGIEQIGLIHRGFSVPEETKYRYPPLWELAEKMRELNPGKTFLCDPSHIAGKRKFLEKIIKQSAKRNFDGLMIESHINPKEALSDSDQQITPSRLKEILKNINW